eukprot:CAMPEP_0183515020 /NCGR_PEP_ID=MMETSP0371-20130417/13251_1 /TAXON_ID=268820 /ORGANISM="Peridinium aciculiferum, Strain PAER-2" /LENGTH=36 /DNA_ID= /DNA_START= /DNA_END= /DNA_ORIENTATION=
MHIIAGTSDLELARLLRNMLECYSRPFQTGIYRNRV